MRARPDLYPVLIFQTRYGGTYEGGRWAAMARREKVPRGAVGDDTTCAEWWSQRLKKVGVGATPDEALQDLERKRPEEDAYVDILGPGELLTTVSFPADQWRLIELAARYRNMRAEDFVLWSITQLVGSLQEEPSHG